MYNRMESALARAHRPPDGVCVPLHLLLNSSLFLVLYSNLDGGVPSGLLWATIRIVKGLAIDLH